MKRRESAKNTKHVKDAIPLRDAVDERRRRKAIRQEQRRAKKTIWQKLKDMLG